MKETASSASLQSLAYLELLYAEYRRAPDSVSAEWRAHFAAAGDGNADGAAPSGPSFKPRRVFNSIAPREVARDNAHLAPRAVRLSDRAHRLVRNHRVRGAGNYSAEGFT